MARKQLEYVLTSDVRGFNRGLDAADSRLARTSGTMKKFGVGLAAGAAAGTAAVVGLAAAAKKAVDDTEELAGSTIKLSRVTGQSTKSASQWVAQAKVRNIETQKLLTSFIAFDKQIVAGAKGTEASAEAFKQLGISQRELKDANFDETIAKVSDAFERMPDGAEKAAIAQRLFGRQAQALMPLLNGGSEALQENLDLTTKYGASLSGKTVQAAKDSAVAQRELKLAFLGVKTSIGSALLPLVTDLREELAEVARDVGPQLKKVTRELDRIFSRDDLSLADKLKMGRQELEKVFGPLKDEAADAFEKMAPKLIDALASSAPRAAGAFLKAFRDASPWGQALTVAFLAGKFGAFKGVGAWAGKALLGRLTAAFAADRTLDAASGVLGRSAGGTMGTSFTSRFKSGFGALKGNAALAAGARSLGMWLGPLAAGAFVVAYKDDIVRFLGGQSFGDSIQDAVVGSLQENVIGPAQDAILGAMPAGDPRGKAAARPGSGRARRRASRGRGGAFMSAGARAAGRGRRPLVRDDGTIGFRNLTRLWIEAGGDPAYAKVMARIALRESGGNPNADNSGLNSNGTTDYGLWQINNGAWEAHFGAATWAQRFNPRVNAQMAVEVMQEQGPTAWATYNAATDARFIGQLPGGAAPKPVTIKGPIACANFLCKKFGLTITDGWRPQDAGYGAVNSWHKQGTPSNPGAVDMVGARQEEACAFFRANATGWAEAMVHDAGSGLHLHIGGLGMQLVVSSADAAGAGAASTGPSAAQLRQAQKKKEQRIESRLTRRAERQAGRKAAQGRAGAAFVQAQRQRGREQSQTLQAERAKYTPDPYGTELAAQDVALAQAEGTADTGDDTLAIFARGVTLRGRLEKINRLLKKKNLPTARRQRLLAEKADILGQLNALNAQYADLTQPPEPVDPTDVTGTGESGPSLTEMIQAQIAQSAEIVAAVRAHTAFQQSLLGTQHGQILAAIGDIASGQIAGNFGLESQTPGFAGGRVRYGAPV